MSQSQDFSNERPRELVVRGPRAESPSRVQIVEALDFDVGDDSEGESLLEYWQILRRRKGAFLLVSFLGMLAGVLATIPATPIYQAQTSLEVMAPNENFLNLNLKDVNPISPVEFYFESFLQTQVKILQSDALRDRVLAKLSVASRPELFRETSRLATWRKALGIPDKPVPADDDNKAPPALTNLQVRIAPNTRLVQVVCDSPNPRFAAEYASALVNEYIEQGLEFRSTGTERTREWLARQLNDLKIKLEKSEEQLQAYGRNSGLLYTAEKENVVEEKLKQLQDELSKAQAERISKQSQYEIASSSPAESLPEVLDNGPLREYQVRLAELRRQLAELSFSLTPAHYKVRRVEAQIAEIEATLRKERNNIVTRIRNEFEAARRREKLLATAYARQAQLVSEQAGKAIQYNILKREVDTSRQLYDSLLQRVKEAGIISAMQASNIRVIDPARTPKRPYKPNLFVNAGLGLLAGVFCGVVFVFLREHADRSFKGPGDAAMYLKVPELGVIPSNTSAGAKSPHGRRRLVISLRNAPKPEPKTDGNGPESKNGNTERVELATWQQQPSALAESFRATLTSILLSGNNGARPRIIVFTSPNPMEGKTTVVCNLGIALAEINRRVLLIDADMRQPRLHSIFDLPNTWGLSDLLREKTPPQSSPLEALVRETHISNLYLLPSGPATLSISNLLYSPRLSELLARFHEEFDAVMIDTPPMMQIADARVLGRLADAVILVVSAGRTSRDVARAANKRLREDGIPVLGTILNRWEPASVGRYGYGYSYYQSYHTERR
ncbi:MAG: polysaccharide biosynthesis tyrosine autokinase [Acidobacteria bacterium]|nr:polysaccharide biosynthesis tyrosine autokinase [Acidobacteriota bacterium]